ncbi:MAG: RsmE family RNA methyltransferase [Flavobacteriales bacterium]
MYLFYHPSALPGATVTMDAAEAAHISKVLRKRDGDQIHLTDGRGKLYEAALIVGKKEMLASMMNYSEIPGRNHKLEIAIAPTKNQDRLEWLVEKAVEIGVEKIVLIGCEHSEKTHVRMERLQRVAIAAMKQSLKYYLPEISLLQSFSEWVANCSANQKFIAHCKNELPRKSLMEAISKGQSCAIAIGPEGDFSEKEIALAIQNNFGPVSFGDQRLRTETAALCAVHTFSLIQNLHSKPQ